MEKGKYPSIQRTERVPYVSRGIEGLADIAGSVEETGRNIVASLVKAPEYLGRKIVETAIRADIRAGEAYDSLRSHATKDELRRISRESAQVIKDQYTGRELWHLIKTGIIAGCIYAIGLG